MRSLYQFRQPIVCDKIEVFPTKWKIVPILKIDFFVEKLSQKDVITSNETEASSATRTPKKLHNQKSTENVKIIAVPNEHSLIDLILKQVTVQTPIVYEKNIIEE